MIHTSDNIFQEYQALVDRYWDSRALFFDECLGINLDKFPEQVAILNALDEYDHIAVKSGTKVGKTFLEAGCILHYATCRPFPKIPCTAPSKETLFNVLWAELAKLHRRLIPIFREQLVWTKQKLYHRNYPEDWFAVARTSTKERSEAMQGMHADYVFRVIDEASGVPEAIFDTWEGVDGLYETKELICANPTRLEGSFYQAFGKSAEFYKTFTLNSEKSELHRIKNFAHCKRVEHKYGRDSNMYRVRILGEFPERDGDSFIPFDLVTDALNREIEPQDHHPKVFGLDVARHGMDHCKLAIRQGDEFKAIESVVSKDLMKVVYYVARRADIEKPVQIFVDANGMGWGVHDRLSELGYPSYAVNVSESPAFDDRQYRRLRDELWGSMRSWLEARRGKLHDNEDKDLLGQLTTPRYKDVGGRIVIESKEEMRRRGVHSPDEADACNLTFAQPVAAYKEDDMTEILAGLGMDGAGGYEPLDRESGY